MFKQADDSDQVFDNTTTFVLLTAWDMEFCDMQVMIMTIDILVVALSPSHPPPPPQKKAKLFYSSIHKILFIVNSV